MVLIASAEFVTFDDDQFRYFAARTSTTSLSSFTSEPPPARARACTGKWDGIYLVLFVRVRTALTTVVAVATVQTATTTTTMAMATATRL